MMSSRLLPKSLRLGVAATQRGVGQRSQPFSAIRALSTYKVGVWPGDGIGVECSELTFEMIKVLENSVGGFQVDTTWYDWGCCDYYDKTGEYVPSDFLSQMKGQDAVFLGAVGYPSRLADHITLDPLIQMRQSFDLFACVRPARTFKGVPMPLAKGQDIDLIVVRENSEGEYCNNGGRFKMGRPEEVSVQSAIHTRLGVERILEHGFQLAMSDGRRRKLTMITKSNAQRYSMVMWDDVLKEVSERYPEVEVDKQHVDAASMNFVLRPETFDVVVASNLYGDILSDLSGAITGSLGLNPSANLDPSRKFPSLFEPVHGSAPDIAGKGIANPTASFLSAGMMLDFLGAPKRASEVLNQAIVKSFQEGQATRDCGGSMSSAEFTAHVCKSIRAMA